MAQQLTAAQLQAYDAQVTNTVLAIGEDMTQPVASGSITPNGSNNTINIPMRQVGLTRGFLLKLVCGFTNTGSGTAVLTPFGAANVMSNVVVTDLDNYQRINTTGWHINMLNTAKEGFPFGAALVAAATDNPVKTGNNFNVMAATASMGPGNSTPTTGTITMYFWIPLAYGKRDLRGALYTGVVNATAFLQFTLNPTPGVASGDATLACYSGANTAVTMTSATYTVYQNYVDQLPRFQSGPNAGAPMLPPLSIQTQYRLVNTSLSAITANQQFPIPFSNFQSFLSASAIYDQAGTLAAGTDINQWSLSAANTLQFFQLDPFTQTLRTRCRIKTDFPAGVYMFDFREQPINTNQAGNMQLQLLPLTAAAGSSVLVGWESFANVQTVLGAQSLPAS